MKVNLNNISEFKNACETTVLIRRENDEFPEALAAFKDAFAEKTKDEKTGVQKLQIVEDGKIKNAIVLTMQEDAKTRAWQKGLVKLFKPMQCKKLKKAEIIATGSYSKDETVQLIKSLTLQDYKFDQFKTSGLNPDLKVDDDKGFEFEELNFYIDVDDAEAIVEEAVILDECVRECRELVNLPANCMTPIMLAERAEKAAEKYGFECEVFGPEAIQEKGMQAYYSVAKGSDEEPRFIVMRYKNNPESDKTLALVGKGVCYDSGGYAIKPASGMAEMHTDMGGAAGVITAITALARKKAEVNVVGLVAACENMISGHAYRNGDIIGSLAGKKIEVANTDAEGRLTLADAVTYSVKEEKADAVIDIATLTGACGIALGDKTTAVLTDCEKLYESACKASAICGDNIWRLPCDDEFAEYNKSERADISNSGGRMAGTVTAGMFVRAFAMQKPFMHFDIAYTSYHGSADDRDPAGATGVGCELLSYVAEKYFA